MVDHLGVIMSITDEVMTTREVAEYLRLAEATIYKLAQAGEIPAIKVGRAWRFRKDLIDEWFEGRVDFQKSPDQ